MNTDSHKKTIRRYFHEIVNGENLQSLADLVHPRLKYPGGEGIDTFRSLLHAFHEAFPDADTSIDDLIAEGDRVVVRSTTRGTHLGPLSGLAATKKTVEYSGIDIFQICDGKIARIWFVRDHLSLMQQLGAVRISPEQ